MKSKGSISGLLCGILLAGMLILTTAGTVYGAGGYVGMGLKFGL
jgi:hypothetical protein